MTDLAPTSRIAIPAEAIAGFPDGVPRQPRGVNRRKFIAGSAIGMASIYSAAHLTWESIWNAAAAERVRALAERARLHLSPGRQRRAQRDRPGLVGLVPGLRLAALEHRPRARALEWHAGRHDRDAGHRQFARVRQPTGLGRRQQRRRQGPRHALRRRLRRRRIGPRRVPGRGLHAARTCRTSRAATTGSPARSRSSRPAGSGAGSTCTARPPTRSRRSRSTPRCRSRSVLRARPSARSRGSARRAFQIAGTNIDANAQVASLAAVPADPANLALTRSRRSTGRRSTSPQQLAGLKSVVTAPGYPAELGDLSEQPAAGGDAARRRTSGRA